MDLRDGRYTAPSTPAAQVFFDTATPTTGGVIFDPNTPAAADTLYVSSLNGSTWVYRDGSYVTYTAPAVNNTEWYITGTTIDAGGNKTASIERTGAIYVSTDSYFNSVRIGKGGGNVSTNTVVGSGAGTANTIGSSNSFFGNTSGIFNTTGINLSGFGVASLYNNTIGSNNVGIGLHSLFSNVTGSNNTSIGNFAGRWLNNGVTSNTTPENSVFLGYGSKSLTNNDTNQIVIGYNAIGKGSNTVQLGNTSITNTYLQGAVTVNNAFTLPTTDGTANYFLKTNGSGTVTWGVAGLSYFTEAQNTAAPNATVYANTLTAVSSTTDADFIIKPKGTGAILASIPDTGAVFPNIGGNKRGQYALDFQRYGQIQSPTHVASGQYAAILSGYWNTASGDQSSVLNGGRNVASGSNSAILGGYLGTASGGWGIILNGQNNTASGLYGSVLNGYANTASGNYSIASGYDSIANSSHSIALGFSTRASNTYAFAQGNSNTASGSESISIGGSLGVASGLRAISIGGYQNVASAAGSVAIGWNANASVVSTANANSALAMMGGTASGVNSIAMGNAQASGQESVALGGQYFGWNVASARNSFATNANTYADGYGSSSFGSYSKSKGVASRISLGSFQDIAPYLAGSAQLSLQSVTIQTSTSAQTEMLTYNSGSAIALIMQNNEGIRVKGSIIGKQSASTNICSYDFDCIIVRGTTAGSTVIKVNNMNLVWDDITLDTLPTLSANTVTGGLSIKSGGKAATTIRWSARIDSTEVILA